MFPKIAKSVFGKKIRLTEERWNHVSERHPEVKNHLHKILKTIAEPDIITKGWEQELIAIKKFGKVDFAVVFRESKKDGFVITAFITRARKYFEKRGIIWNK